MQWEKSKLELDALQLDHNKMKLSVNSRLSVMKKTQEVKTDKNQEQEQKFLMDKVTFRNQVCTVAEYIYQIILWEF